MYSPKINAEYIPLLYRKAKELRIPMTKLVNQIIASALKKEENNATDGIDPTHEKAQSVPKPDQ